MPERAQFCKIDGVADREAIEREIEVAEDLRKIGKGKGLVLGTIARVLEQLGQEFPKDLIIHCTEDAQQASSSEKIEQRSRANNVKLPGWKQEGTISVQHFKCPLTLVPDLSGLPHGPA